MSYMRHRLRTLCHYLAVVEEVGSVDNDEETTNDDNFNDGHVNSIHKNDDRAG